MIIRVGPLEVTFYWPQRSWAKVIFSQACVKNSVHRGGGCLPQCMLEYTPRRRPTPPPWSSRHPPGPDPPGSRHPPRTRHPLGPDTPPLGPDHPKQTPPSPGSRPPLEQTPPPEYRAPYSLQAASTHPTGMHSCSCCC